MLASISPLGERARRQSYPITVTAYIVASTLAGAALGAALGVIGSPAAGDDAGLVAIGMLAFAGVLGDAHAFGWRVPGPRRQVNEDWLATYRGWVYGAGFGAQLGLGFTTIITASATWVAFACALCAGSGRGGLLVGATFGVVRALPVLATARVHDAGRLRTLVRRLEQARPRVTRVAAALQLVLAFAIPATLIGRVG